MDQHNRSRAYSRNPSFAFAQYSGRARGVPCKWICFSGLFSVSMNEPMVEVLLDTLDAGGEIKKGTITLPDEIADLAEMLEAALDVKRGPKMFSSQGECVYVVLKFGPTFQIHCTEEGLVALKDGITAGLDDSPNGRSAGAFMFAIQALLEQWDRVKRTFAVPAG